MVNNFQTAVTSIYLKAANYIQHRYRLCGAS